MGESPAPVSHRSPALLTAAFLTLATLAYSLHLLIFLRSRGAAASWLPEVAEAAVHWMAWLVLVPAVLAVARAVPVTGRLSAIAIHLLGSAAFSSAQVAIRSALDRTLIHGQRTLEALKDGYIAMFGRTFVGGLLTYWAFVVGRQALLRYRDQKEAAAIRNRQLAEAQLRALQNQIQPHFLFNALNGISSLMHEDVEAANRMLLELSALLRAFLAENGSLETTVESEEELLRNYVAVEQARLGPRLRFSMKVDAAVRHAFVPRLILQPLVENSIRHGVSPRREGGSVHVVICSEGGELRIAVCDDGRGLPERWSESGIGLRNCRSRLEQLYGSRHHFELCNAESGGVTARIDIPLRFAAERT